MYVLLEYLPHSSIPTPCPFRGGSYLPERHLQQEVTCFLWKDKKDKPEAFDANRKWKILVRKGGASEEKTLIFVNGNQILG